MRKFLTAIEFDTLIGDETVSTRLEIFRYVGQDVYYWRVWQTELFRLIPTIEIVVESECNVPADEHVMVERTWRYDNFSQQIHAEDEEEAIDKCVTALRVEFERAGLKISE